MEIKEPKIKELEKFIYNPVIRIKTVENIHPMRIEYTEELTRIDFIYYASRKYINGGWVEIDKNSFIRPVGSNQRLTMVKAMNIPLAPVKHYFKSTKDVLYYTLYFPPLPRETKAIDIIEKELPGGTWFNFYGVSMDKVRNEKLIFGN